MNRAGTDLPGAAAMPHLAEIDWQTEILAREFFERIALTLIAFALCLIFVDPWTVGLLAAVNVGLESASHVLMQNARRRHSRRIYGLHLAMIAVTETAFVAAAGFVWLSDEPYAQAFAVGLVMTSLLHLTVVRAIHLPAGLAGLAALAITVSVFNTIYWLRAGSPLGLALSSTSAFCTLAYTFIAMLSNNRLHRAIRQEEERATRADVAKSRFLAVLSHELRTPLNSVLGMAHAALAEAGDAEQRDRFALMVGAASDLATILDDATDMSAIEDGRFRLRERPVDLPGELEATLGPFREQALRRGSTLAFRAEPGLPRRLRLDPQRLRQCLVNLLGNALKHAGEGPVTVTTAAEGDGFRIDIADSGPGIAPGEEEQVFEPFRRGRTEAQGMGLGLTISRALARQMGGDVTLLPSLAGTGARFRLWLPARTDETGADAAADAAVGARLPDLAGRVVLVVDDIGSNRMVAAMQLRPTSARVIEAESGDAALAILSGEAVDLVLLDLNMPGMDGTETVARIRALAGANARTPVVAMTADALAAEAVPRGMDGILVKPVDPARLARELARHFPG